MKNFIIVDIDGVICKNSKYLPLLKSGQLRSFLDAVEDEEPEPIPVMIDFINKISRHYDIIFCSGRRESQRKKTAKMLKGFALFRNLFYVSETLLLRKPADNRPDHIVKLELVKDAGILFDDIAFVLEDRQSVVDAWRKAGVICLQVAKSEF